MHSSGVSAPQGTPGQSRLQAYLAAAGKPSRPDRRAGRPALQLGHAAMVGECGAKGCPVLCGKVIWRRRGKQTRRPGG